MAVHWWVCTRWVRLHLIAEKMKILIHRMIDIGQTNLSAYTIEFFNQAPTGLERCQIIKYFI
jgi:hypothetical protein